MNGSRITRALTLTQPWAMLCVAARLDTGRVAKQIESRSWRLTPETIGGGLTVAIHAAVGINRHVRHAISRDTFRLKPQYADPLVACGYSNLDPWHKKYAANVDTWNETTGGALKPLPLGAVVGVVTVMRCVPAHVVRGRHRMREISNEEFALGHYDETDGRRFGWYLSNPRQLATPIPCKGAQQLWTLPPDVSDTLDTAEWVQ